MLDVKADKLDMDRNKKDAVYDYKIKEKYEETKFFKDFNTKIVSNFSYQCEQQVYPTALLRSTNHPEGEYVKFDMNKCYYSSIFTKLSVSGLKARDTIPIFSSVDIIKIFKSENGITPNTIYFLSRVGLLKLEKYGWTSNLLHWFNVEFFLNLNIINTADITHFRQASRCVEVDYFEKVATQSLNQENISEEKLELLKYFSICNGIMGKRNSSYQDRRVVLRNELDQQIYHMRYKNHNFVTDDNNELPAVDIHLSGGDYLELNSRSIYDYIVNVSNLQINRAHLILKEMGYHVYDIRTDSLEVKLPHSESGKTLDELCEKFLVYCDKYYRDKNILNAPRGDNLLIDENGNYLTDKFGDGKKYFKIEKHILYSRTEDNPAENKFKIDEYELGYNHNISVSSKYIDGQELQENMIKELGDLVSKMEIVNSRPGTGKTHRMKKEDKYDFALTVSNICCRNLDTDRVKGKTIYSALGMNRKTDKIKDSGEREDINKLIKRFKGKKIWIDEFSMLGPEIFDVILILSKHAEIYLTGDIDQIPPIGHENLKHEKKIFIETLLKDAEVLTTEYRNSQDLIDLRDLVLSEPCLSKKVENTLNELSVENVDYKTIDDHLVHTNEMADFVNNEVLKARGLTADFENHEYSVGLTLISLVNLKEYRIYKSEIYKIIESNENKTTIGNDKNRLTLATESICKYFTAGYARTVHSVQGLTLNNDFVIHCPVYMYRWNPSILYTAITRGTTLEKIKFVHTKIPGLFKSNERFRKKEIQQTNGCMFESKYNTV